MTVLLLFTIICITYQLLQLIQLVEGTENSVVFLTFCSAKSSIISHLPSQCLFMFSKPLCLNTFHPGTSSLCFVFSFCSICVPPGDNRICPYHNQMLSL